jgi:hypothetical protein
MPVRLNGLAVLSGGKPVSDLIYVALMLAAFASIAGFLLGLEKI